MRVFREPDSRDWQKQLGSATLGALGGLVVGTLMSRVLQRADTRTTRGLRDRSYRFQPAPMQRPREDQPELDRLETSVLGEFLMDPLLRDRSIEIGAISEGIIELSGTVMSQEELHRAVEIANRVNGVDTVVNRMNIERPYRTTSLRSTSTAGGSFEHTEGRVGGMGRRRQGRDTEPLQRDDSQPMRQAALSTADREQLADEGFADSTSAARRQVDNPTNFDEDELDNQDPHGKHARITLDRPPEELNSFARVGQRGPRAADMRLNSPGTDSSDNGTAMGDEGRGRQT